MGVHGLTTYLRENKRALAKTVELPTDDSVAPIVVDGWSFIYNLHHDSNLPWVYGGEYEEFSRLVEIVVRAWISVGLKVFFVFDGAYPQLKFSTLVARLGQSHIQPSLLFFRTSTVSRATPRFLHESRIVPPLMYAACLRSLESLRRSTSGLEIHFADEEGDPYAVELAGRLGGYVAGNDSDFVVLNSDGYRGYIPLDEMVWTVPFPDDTPTAEVDGDFQPVRKPKGKKKPTHDPKLGRGLIPPDFTSGLTLSFTVYNPSALASHLNLPVTLLPLLGALVGNDFSNQSASVHRNVQLLFFERRMTPIQRISHVATTVQSILSPVSQKRKQKHQVGSVMDLIDRTVNALLSRLISTMGSGEIDAIVERIVESTLQYAIPKYDGETSGQQGLWVTEVCALHEADICPILPMLSRLVTAEALAADNEQNEALRKANTLRALYLGAYRKGHLSPKIMNVLNTGTYWPRLFLENPDLETVSRTIGRSLRQWSYSILDDAVGLPDIQQDSPLSDGTSTASDDDDELVDVVEESDDDDSKIGVNVDPLAPLRGALQRLHMSEDEGTEPPASLSSQSRSLRLPYPRVITEYIRRGTRIAEEQVIVPHLSDLLSSISSSDFNAQSAIPLLLRSEEDRLTVLLRALDSDIPSIRVLPRESLAPALALRCAIGILHVRAQEEGSNEREKERWTRREASCILASFSCATSNGTTPETDQEFPPITDRNIQLVAQVLMALECIEHFSQVLLLSERVPPVAHVLSGKACHSYLTGIKPVGADSVPKALRDACEHGLDANFGAERRKKAKKPRKEKETAPSIAIGTGLRVPNGGLFNLLADAEA